MARHGVRRLSARGFSSFEALFGGGLVALCALGFAAALPAADRSAHPGVHADRAAALVEQMMAAVRNRDAARIGPYNGRDGAGTDTRDPANFPEDAPRAVGPEGLGPFGAGHDLARWGREIETALAAGPGVSGAYGTVRVESVARDASGQSVLDRVTVTVGWTESGAERRLTAATLASAL